MRYFLPLFRLGIKRTSKDFFILFYNIVFPLIIIMLLGYLTSKSYGTEFTSYNYYTIVTIPFCILMGIISVSYAAQDEKISNTSYRYMISPISIKELVLSKLFSCTIILSLCNVITLVIIKGVFQISFGGNFLAIIFLLVCESTVVSAIGLFLGLACKNLDILRNVINIPIVIFGFLGGVFFPVSSLNPVVSLVINISPLTWVNRSIVTCIYDDNLQPLFNISSIFVMTSILMTVLTVKLFKREAFI
ncbi:ABC transporter permease [Clostridioides sp. ZZV15-6388]|uniref:ABC transporter permease n=1 Tax=Clostridioides sp. ZZV15-6388 TaxID=2811499 RepID=UPI001D0FF2FF|nr:ABC transporter permease [Clostridioides sp. ZZV15-6388]